MDRVCGLDVHKDSVFMCILTANGEKIEDVFGTLTPELDRLRDTLVSHGVGKVAMESTSIYWVPIWRILECDFDVKLVNPYFIRQLPGRKTDIKDLPTIQIPSFGKGYKLTMLTSNTFRSTTIVYVPLFAFSSIS